MELSNIIFLFFLLFLGYLFNFLLLNFKRRNFDFLLDNQFNKPQAFHDQSTYRAGGLLIYFLLPLARMRNFLRQQIHYPFKKQNWGHINVIPNKHELEDK